MKPKAIALTCLAGAALILAACKVDIISTLRPDGSGELRTEMGLTPEDKQALEAFSNGGTQDLCTSIQAQGGSPPPGMVFEQEERGDETWCVATEPFGNLDDLRSLYADMQGVTVNRLEIKDGRLYYDITLDLSEGSTPPSSIDLTWQIEVPGTVGVNNADSVEGRRLTWGLPLGGTVNVHAESVLGGLALPGGTSPWVAVGAVVLACLCLIVLAVIVVVVVVVARRRKPAA
jgi:hypothetical protein